MQMGVCKLKKSHFSVYISDSLCDLSTVVFCEEAFSRFCTLIEKMFKQHVLPTLLSRFLPVEKKQE